MIRAIATLFRLKLSFLNGITALTGYLLFPSPVEFQPALAAFAGVSLLAAGGSAVNQVVERDLDRRMLRTRMRPLPQGVLTPAATTTIASVTILAGLLLLATTGSATIPLLGVAGLVWYLAVYTPLKTRTTLALPIGALCGAFPPLIGWCLAGGSPADYRVILLAGLFFIWQIPHFWLLQQRHEADYQRAGILLLHFRTIRFGRISLLAIWLLALMTATLMLPALGVIGPGMAYWLLLIALIPIAVVLLRSERLMFPAFSLFPLTLTALLVFQKTL